MLEYKTSFIPPMEYEIDEYNKRWSRKDVIDETCKYYEQHNKFDESKIQSYESMLVAYAQDRIIGFQLLDYDPYEMNIVLGRQMLSLTLTSEENEGLKEHFQRQAYSRWEDLF